MLGLRNQRLHRHGPYGLHHGYRRKRRIFNSDAHIFGPRFVPHLKGNIPKLYKVHHNRGRRINYIPLRILRQISFVVSRNSQKWIKYKLFSYTMVALIAWANWNLENSRWQLLLLKKVKIFNFMSQKFTLKIVKLL